MISLYFDYRSLVCLCYIHSACIVYICTFLHRPTKGEVFPYLFYPTKVLTNTKKYIPIKQLLNMSESKNINSFQVNGKLDELRSRSPYPSSRTDTSMKKSRCKVENREIVDNNENSLGFQHFLHFPDLRCRIPNSRLGRRLWRRGRRRGQILENIVSSSTLWITCSTTSNNISGCRFSSSTSTSTTTTTTIRSFHSCGGSVSLLWRGWRKHRYGRGGKVPGLSSDVILHKLSLIFNSEITRKSSQRCASLTCITWISCIYCILESMVSLLPQKYLTN